MSDDQCTCGIPEDALILSELRIVEFMDPSDGEIYKMDLSHGNDGQELPLGKALELAAWAQAIHTAPMIVDLVAGMMHGDDEE